MRWPEPPAPAPMGRVAVVAPVAALRPSWSASPASGTVEVDPSGTEATPGEAARRLQRLGRAAGGTPRLAAVRPDLDLLERSGRDDLLAGEAELEERAAGAVRRGAVAALAGWVPRADLPDLTARLAGVGGAVVPLPSPPGVDPPTLVRHAGAARSFEPLVGTYATVPYRDVDPTVAAGVAYIVMFGMMFGDAGHGLLLLLAGLALRAGWPRRWPGSGSTGSSSPEPASRRPCSVWRTASSSGPPASSRRSGSTRSRSRPPCSRRQSGWVRCCSPARTASGSSTGCARAAGRWPCTPPAASPVPRSSSAPAWWRPGGTPAGDWLALVGGTVAVIGLALAFTGLYVESGGGGAGAGQAVVELVDTVTRLGGNVVSFTRLAAFGITHAAIAGIVWTGAVALWGKGPIGAAGAVVLFAVGTALAFGLEALVAGIQALRLEYYELFSRVFAAEGRPFRPWRLPVVPAEEVPR